VPNGHEDRLPHSRNRELRDGTLVISETDLREVPPGSLARVPDRRTEATDDPNYGLQRILAEEKKMGLVRPTLPLVGVRPWTAENWERPADAHRCEPRDDPRRDGDPLKVAAPASDRPADRLPCPVCGGRPLREMIALAPMRVGKNRMTRPPALVEGGEACTRCGRHFQEDRWPSVARLAPEVDGKPGKGGKGGPS
jgi:hypothetical protein